MLKWLLPSPLFVGIAVALVLALAWRRLPRTARITGVLVLGACYLLATPLVSAPLARLTALPPQPPCAFAPAGVAVFGGGAADTAPAEDLGALDVASLRRLLGGVALWREQTPDGLLLLAGGSRPGGIAESLRMARLAEALGVPPAAIRTETASRTTRENAAGLAALQPAVPRRLWLVTSALHMRRARRAMERAGFEVCVAPVDAYPPTARAWPLLLLPDSAALKRSEAAIHEWLGLAWYRLRDG